MNYRKILVCVAALLLPALLSAEGLDPKKLLEQPTDTWPTYNGDYSGRRFSPLKTINADNVKSMTLSWVYRTNTSSGRGGGGGGGVAVKATPLLVNGVLYFTVPDHTWAVDARTGRQLWHFGWETQGGIHIGNRGVGIYGEWLYFETPDCYLVCLNMKDGTERWHVQIADVKQEYFSTPSPIVIGNHIVVGVGGDSLDVPGYLEARDPETGALQWHYNTTPRKGEPGFDSWPSEEAAAHGGGMTWVPGTYDPELNMLYWPTGNPQPVLSGHSRPGANLWTCSIVALNPDTGKMIWGFQASPHDTHDWDAAQTPVLIDGEFDGKPRKMLAQANRNGYFFLLDRKTGEALVSKPYTHINWSKGVDEKGSPIPNPEKEPQTDGALVSPDSGGGANWPPPSFDPETGLFYVDGTDSYSIFYLTDTSKKPQGWAGRDSGLWSQAVLKAIDYKTGEIRWKHAYPGEGSGSSGVLTTAGKLLFSGDPSGSFIARNPATGEVLWHARLQSSVSNGPMTYELDGQQYVLVAAGDTLYAFTVLE